MIIYFQKYSPLVKIKHQKLKEEKQVWNVKGTAPTNVLGCANRFLSSPSASDLPPELLRGSMCSVSSCFSFYRVKKKRSFQHSLMMPSRTTAADLLVTHKNWHCCTNM